MNAHDFKPTAGSVNPPKMLVVDDNANNRDLLSRQLQREGYIVETADGGHIAIERALNDAFDLILLDIMMPEITGIEVLKHIRLVHGPDALPIIMATARDDSRDIAEALKFGANDYVTKPLDLIVLMARVRTQLALLNLRRESERLRALREEFFSIASHDLKSPLAQIMSYASLIIENAPDGPAEDRGLGQFGQRIVESAMAMRGIVEEFVDFQIVEHGTVRLDPEKVDLDALGRRCVESNRARAEQKGVDLICESSGEAGTLSIDIGRTEQVLQNLLDNAIACSPRGSEVRIRNFLDGDYHVTEVIDSGPGLSEMDMKIVFEKYVRLEKRGSDSRDRNAGLGLAIARKLVDIQGGQIGVRNNDQRGATFWFSLPAGPAD